MCSSDLVTILGLHLLLARIFTWQNASWISGSSSAASSSEQSTLFSGKVILFMRLLGNLLLISLEMIFGDLWPTLMQHGSPRHNRVPRAPHPIAYANIKLKTTPNNYFSPLFPGQHVSMQLLQQMPLFPLLHLDPTPWRLH